MDVLDSTRPHYIRCIKPNLFQSGYLSSAATTLDPAIHLPQHLKKARSNVALAVPFEPMPVLDQLHAAGYVVRLDAGGFGGRFGGPADYFGGESECIMSHVFSSPFSARMAMGLILTCPWIRLCANEGAPPCNVMDLPTTTALAHDHPTHILSPLLVATLQHHRRRPHRPGRLPLPPALRRLPVQVCALVCALATLPQLAVFSVGMGPFCCGPAKST